MESKYIEIFRPFNSELAEFKKRYDGIVYDLNDPKQNKQARSDRYAIGKVISRLDKTHSDIKKPILEQVKAIDGARKDLKDNLLIIQDKIKHQIQTHEDAIKRHAEELQNKINIIERASYFDNDPSSSLIKQRLNQLSEINPSDESIYEDRTKDAIEAHNEAIKTLNSLYEKTLKQEAEKEELNRLRQEEERRAKQEREESIAKAAAEKARKEAEFLYQKKLEQAKRQKEKEYAERAEKEEMERLKKESEARTKENIERVHKNILDDFLALKLPGKEILKSIILMKIRNIKIQY